MTRGRSWLAPFCPDDEGARPSHHSPTLSAPTLDCLALNEQLPGASYLQVPCYLCPLGLAPEGPLRGLQARGHSSFQSF